MFLFSFSRYRDNENSFHEDMSRNSIFDVQTPPNSISLLNDTVSHTLHMYINFIRDGVHCMHNHIYIHV